MGICMVFISIRWMGNSLLGHALGTFSANPFTGKNWEQRKIQELMEKERLNN